MMVDIYDVFADNVIKKVYTLDTEMLSQGYEAASYHSDFINDLSWAKFMQGGLYRTIPVAGCNTITMSRHIRNYILITQYGGCNGGIVRIWSILEGTLLKFYRSKNVEHVLAISANYRYIATYNEDDKTRQTEMTDIHPAICDFLEMDAISLFQDTNPIQIYIGNVEIIVLIFGVSQHINCSSSTKYEFINPHAFIARLRLFKNESFQKQFRGGAMDNDGNPIANATTYTMHHVSSSNNFSNVFRVFSMVWFFIFGVFDPFNDGDVGVDTMTSILAIVFSFVTVLFFSNMVIALMSSTAEDVKKNLEIERGIFILQTNLPSPSIAVVAEIEMLWCTPHQKYDCMNNPAYIYHVANSKIVKDHVESMRAETDRLIGELRRSDKYSL